MHSLLIDEGSGLLIENGMSAAGEEEQRAEGSSSSCLVFRRDDDGWRGRL